jgi:hypothetical protein
LRHVPGPSLFVFEDRHGNPVGALEHRGARAFAQLVLHGIEPQDEVAGAGLGLDRALLLHRGDACVVEPRHGVAGHLDDRLHGVVEAAESVEGPRCLGDGLGEVE